jgi:hypothetical protein
MVPSRLLPVRGRHSVRAVFGFAINGVSRHVGTRPSLTAFSLGT